MYEENEIVITKEDCEITPYDVAELLKDEAHYRLHLQISYEENGLKGLQKALGDVARAKKMTDVAEKTGLTRQNLYKALSADGNPSADTLFRVIKALGFNLKIV